MRRRFFIKKEKKEEPELSPHCLLNIKSKFVHNILKSFVPRCRLLRISKHCKKLQSLCELTIEDYEVYHILKCNIGKNFSLSERPLDSALRTMQNIFELTKSESLFIGNHTEINVPTPIYAMTQLSNSQIIAATEQALLIIEFNKKRNSFDIKKEIKLNLNGVIKSLIEIGNNTLLISNLFQSMVVNLDTEQTTFELNGYSPIILRDGRICYIVNENFIKIIKLNDPGYEEEIPIVKAKIKEDEDVCEMNLIKYGIQLKNGNILLISLDKTITEYDLELKRCIQVIPTDIEFLDTCYELKDGRIALTAEDNANFFLINRLDDRSDNLITLSGHSNTVIKVLQLPNEQIISASYDGKVKIWYKIKAPKKNLTTFVCAMTLQLFNDYIRTFLFMNDGRVLITGDDKTLRALGVNNYIGNFTIEFKPDDKRTKKIKSFELIDNRIN